MANDVGVSFLGLSVQVDVRHKLNLVEHVGRIGLSVCHRLNPSGRVKCGSVVPPGFLHVLLSTSDFIGR